MVNFKVRNNIKASLLSIAQMVGFLVVMGTGTLILYKYGFLGSAVIKIFWSIIVIFAFILVVRWHAKSFSYQCIKCGHIFNISAWTDFLKPGGYYKFLIKCPQCHQRTKAAIVDRVKSESI